MGTQKTSGGNADLTTEELGAVIKYIRSLTGTTHNE